MPIQLAPGEIRRHEARSGNFTVLVTNRRVVAEQTGTGRQDLTSLPLEKIDHARHLQTSSPIWLVLGAILGFMGVILAAAGQGQDDFGEIITGFGVALMIVAIILVIIYFATRSQRVIFSTQGGSISVGSRGLAANVTEQLLAATEVARQNRVKELYEPGSGPTDVQSGQPSNPPKVELVDS